MNNSETPRHTNGSWHVCNCEYSRFSHLTESVYSIKSDIGVMGRTLYPRNILSVAFCLRHFIRAILSMRLCSATFCPRTAVMGRLLELHVVLWVPVDIFINFWWYRKIFCFVCYTEHCTYYVIMWFTVMVVWQVTHNISSGLLPFLWSRFC